VYRKYVKNQYKHPCHHPGTRLMGVAFLDDGKLLYHSVKVIARGRSPEQTLQRAKGVILRLIR